MLKVDGSCKSHIYKSPTVTRTSPSPAPTITSSGTEFTIRFYNKKGRFNFFFFKLLFQVFDRIKKALFMSNIAH